MNLDFSERDILFIDSHCLLCDGLAKRILASGKYQDLFFSALNGDTFKAVSKSNGPEKLETVILYTKGKFLVKSEAVLEVGEKMGGWRALLSGIGRIFPLGFRNMIYDFVANNRYRWFGRSEADLCEIPQTQHRHRFI